MKKTLLTVILSVGLSVLTAYGIVKAATPQATGTTPVYSSDSGYNTPSGPVNLSVSDYPDFTYAAERAVDAVVFVKVTITRQYQPIQDPFFRFFFGDEGGQRQSEGSGSGVIISPDGYIVTNNHVVADASKIEITLNNNKVYEAKVIGTDPATDVALVKIEASGLPTIEFADSDNLRLGEWVLAIGSPLGEQLRSTITAGIVSAKGRSMPNYTGEFKIESFIQTDAAVNPGNSGGALVNKAGQLVGINTAIVSTTGSYTGYSFAVPSNIVHKIVSDLIDFGSVKRARLGVVMSPVTEKVASEMKLSSLDGVYINEVVSGSAAEKAGIKQGDVLVKLDSTRIKSPSALQVKVNNFRPGDRTEATVVRDGKTLVLPVLFEEAPDVEVASDGSASFYGAKLRAATREELAAVGLKNGVLIVSAGKGKLAQAGAGDGYIIEMVNDVPVSKPQDVIDVAKKRKRSVYLEGKTSSGNNFYFGFGKD
ncbi:MAG: trypsin-like peptidase domain-containing protein [Bacteroidales bacterium]|nr:trypsin-like peptidase domain-containing protein [Bacteroidales bacterium]